MINQTEQKFVELLRKTFKTEEEKVELERLSINLELELNFECRELIDQIRKKSLAINSIWDLVNTNEPYPEIIDILIEHLNRNYHDRNKEGIIRALCVKEAKGKVAESLINLFRSTPVHKVNLRWAIVNTLRHTISTNQLQLILPLIVDKENEIYRDDFIRILKRSKKGKEILSRLLEE